jgi:hypothetical protein
MAEARQVDEWNRASLMCVLLANPHRDSKKRPRPYEIKDFHPFIDRPKRQPKSAASLFAKLEEVDGIKPTVVTEATWGTQQK